MRGGGEAGVPQLTRCGHRDVRPDPRGQEVGEHEQLEEGRGAIGQIDAGLLGVGGAVLVEEVARDAGEGLRHGAHPRPAPASLVEVALRQHCDY